MNTDEMCLPVLKCIENVSTFPMRHYHNFITNHFYISYIAMRRSKHLFYKSRKENVKTDHYLSEVHAEI